MPTSNERKMLSSNEALKELICMQPLLLPHDPTTVYIRTAFAQTPKEARNNLVNHGTMLTITVESNNGVIINLCSSIL